MQYIVRYDVEATRWEEFRPWLADNDDPIRQSQRPGWEYLGTWFTVQGFGTYGAETRWELDDYAALGAQGSAASDEITRKWFEFIDQGRPAEAYLMKSATDVIILE